MTKSKIEEKIFQDCWEIEFFNICGKKHDAIRLICYKTISIPIHCNINHHYIIQHTGFSKIIPSYLKK